LWTSIPTAGSVRKDWQKCWSLKSIMSDPAAVMRGSTDELKSLKKALNANDPGVKIMKGIILAGGTGSRLYPLTKVTNKHLLPVYDKPMIYYPPHTLIDAGLDEILIVSGRGHAGHFLELLGSGSEWDVRLTYEIQDEAGGIAQALGLAEGFADEEDVVVILGDNIFQDSIREDVHSFLEGGRIFLKKVPDANRFGVAELDGTR